TFGRVTAAAATGGGAAGGGAGNNAQASEVLFDLCLETLSTNGSILIFCPTKKSCVVEAEVLARYLARFAGAAGAEQHATDATMRKRHEMLAKLADTAVGLCPVLAETVPHGVAYHHAGLTLEE